MIRRRFATMSQVEDVMNDFYIDFMLRERRKRELEEQKRLQLLARYEKMYGNKTSSSLKQRAATGRFKRDWTHLFNLSFLFKKLKKGWNLLKQQEKLE